MSSSEYLNNQPEHCNENRQPAEEARDAHRHGSAWIRKYLDLADTAMGRGEEQSQK
jgi:hypothetical protein